MSEWHCVAQLRDLEEEIPLEIKLEDKNLGLYMIGDKIYALENICPHAYAIITQGFVDGDTIECPLHEAVFHIPTGECLSGPGGRSLVQYETRINGDDIEVKLEQ